MEDTKKPISEQMTEFDKTKMMTDFSKGLTLWGSNKVVGREKMPRQVGRRIDYTQEEMIQMTGLSRSQFVRGLKRIGEMYGFNINDFKVEKDNVKLQRGPFGSAEYIRLDYKIC